MDYPERRIQIRRVYEGQTSEDPRFWDFAVCAGENYDDVDSDWENACQAYDVGDMPGYHELIKTGREPTVLDSDVQLFLKHLIESGHIDAGWDK